VGNNVISISLEMTVRVFSVHPFIERVMHKQVSEQRRDRRPL
jgi:hypothetical protein